MVVEQHDRTSRVATIVLRGSTENAMDDIERAVDDGVNAFKALTKAGRRALALNQPTSLYQQLNSSTVVPCASSSSSSSSSTCNPITQVIPLCGARVKQLEGRLQ